MDPLLPMQLGGLADALTLLGNRDLKNTSAKLLQSAEQEGFTRGLQKSENTEIYSRCHFLGGQGLWNVSGIIMTSLLSTHPSLHDCLEMEEIYAS